MLKLRSKVYSLKIILKFLPFKKINYSFPVPTNFSPFAIVIFPETILIKSTKVQIPKPPKVSS